MTVDFPSVSWDESSKFRYSRTGILNDKKHKRLNKIIFNKIVKIAIKVSYEAIQKQYSQNKKRNENLQGFVAETSELITSEKEAAKIRNNSKRGLISIQRTAGPETIIITFIKADTDSSINTKSVLKGIIEVY